MRFEVQGTPMPVALCYLEDGESIRTEKGAMSWMTPNLKMETEGGGVGKMFSKAFSGEAMFHNVYTAQGGPGMIAMASSFPGEIMIVDVTDNPIIAQKHAFLACEPTVEMKIHFQKKVGSGFFGGEGFIMQSFTGKGKVALEIDGSLISYDLAAGQSMLLDTGTLALMTADVQIEIESVKGIGNKMLGGEGFFNTKVTGPGKIWLQTMPLYAQMTAGFSH